MLTISGGTLAPAAQDACTYKRTQRTVVLDFTRLPQVGGDLAVHQADLRVGPGGSIVSSESFPGGAQDHPCGAATTANTRLIQVVGAGERDIFVLDERSGRLADLMRVNLGGGAPGTSLDAITMYLHGGTSTFGSTATDIDGDGVADLTSASDLDWIQVFDSDGPDTVSEQGGGALGGEFAYELRVFAGAGDDTLTGGAGPDGILDGEQGKDTITAGSGPCA